ncbi:MAG: helix-turn-helix domain-containing protein [Weeksellaceae bacterium]
MDINKNDKIYSEILNFFNSTNSSDKEKWLKNNTGEFYTSEIYRDNIFTVREYEYLYYSDHKIEITTTENPDYVEVAFFLSPHPIKDSINNITTYYKPLHCYVYSISNSSEVTIWFEKNNRYRNLDIYIKKNYFSNLETDIPQLNHFVEKLNMTASGINHLYPESIPINAKIFHLLKKLRTSPFKSFAKQLFVNSIIYEILLEIHQISKSQNKGLTYHTQQNVNKEDLEKIKTIEKYIIANLGEQFSIDYLSKKFGINRTKLKENFKKVYGKGVFEYTFSYRMQEASELLMTHNQTIKEISYLLGYSSPTSFSTAFKKHTGIAPSEFKKAHIKNSKFYK